MWTIKQTEEFQNWFEGSAKSLQDDTLEHVEVLRQLGPHLGRPLVDTLKNSLIKNLKKLRFNSGNKAGSGDKIFYDKMIHQSEKIYSKYLEECKKKVEKGNKYEKEK
jgi:hypothetical protein